MSSGFAETDRCVVECCPADVESRDEAGVLRCWWHKRVAGLAACEYCGDVDVHPADFEADGASTCRVCRERVALEELAASTRRLVDETDRTASAFDDLVARLTVARA